MTTGSADADMTGKQLRRRPPQGGLLFAFSLYHVIMSTNAEKMKECFVMTEKKKTMARILALVIAGIMILSVALAILLK